MYKTIMWLLLSFPLWTGCVSTYVEPSITKDSATILVKNRVGMQPEISFYVRIDNAYAPPKPPYNINKRVNILPGKHTIHLEPTVFYNHRAKYAEPIDYSWLAKKGHNYSVQLKPDRLTLGKYDEDINGVLTMYDNGRVLFRKNLYMKDSLLRSTVPKNEQAEIMGVVAASLIY